jgi:hypothetical protein
MSENKYNTVHLKEAEVETIIRYTKKYVPKVKLLKNKLKQAHIIIFALSFCCSVLLILMLKMYL